MIGRFFDNRYIIETENEKSCGMGVFIDIYPFDGLGANKLEAFFYAVKGDFLSSLYWQSTRLHFDVSKVKSLPKKVCLFNIYFLSRILGKKRIRKRIERLINHRDYDKSNYVSCVIWLAGLQKEIYKKEWFDETIMTKFEKYEFRIPKCYKDILKNIYGDYMKLPPLESRVGHHFFKAYKK